MLRALTWNKDRKTLLILPKLMIHEDSQ